MPTRPAILLLACLLAFHTSTAIVAQGTVSDPARPTPIEIPTIKHDADLSCEIVLRDPIIAQPLETKFDEQGRMWVVEYRQYPDPAGISETSRDEYWRVQYDRMPPIPPHAVDSPFRGKDRISIHHDTNGDGAFDQHSIFVDGLNLATSVEFDRDGVWVLNPPYLMFYPDKDGDLKPDAPPVCHLQGFGIEDSHAIANSLRWGPDGWLYGAQGSTCTMSVTSPLWSEENARSVECLGQCLWRYHPKTHRFEIFAEGGGNTFGLEIDAGGDFYSGHNGGNTRGFHFVPGGFYRKNFGKHGGFSEPFRFGYLSWMPHHRVERFSHDFVIYEADLLPQRFRNQLVAVDILHHHLVLSEIDRFGSTFETHDHSIPVSSKQQSFRPVHLGLGPDGALYLSDWADLQVNHYRNHEGFIEPASGRIYRIAPQAGVRNSLAISSKNLVADLQSTNRSRRQSALRLIRQKQQTDLIPELRKLYESDSPYALDAFWALHSLSAWSTPQLQAALKHDNKYIRRWAIRFLSEDKNALAASALQLIEVAKSDSSPVVAVELASLLGTQAPRQVGWPILVELLKRSEFSQDAYFPLMVWWAFLDVSAAEPITALEQLEANDLPREPIFIAAIEARMLQWWTMQRTLQAWDAVAAWINQIDDAKRRQRAYAAIAAGLEGMTIAKPSEALKKTLHRHAAELPLELKLRFQLPGADAQAISAIKASKQSQAQKILDVISEVQANQLIQPMLGLVQSKKLSPARNVQLIRCLGNFAANEIGETLLSQYGGFNPEEQQALQDISVRRITWSRMFVSHVESGKILAKDVPFLIANRMRLHGDAELDARIDRHWPNTASSTNIPEEFERWKKILSVGGKGDVVRGAAIYQQHCAACHQLFGKGGKVGPDLTAYQRSNRDLMLLAILAPSAEIREGFETCLLRLEDGSVLTGVLLEQTDDVVRLIEPNGSMQRIAKSQIDQLKFSPVSTMPNGLLGQIKDQAARDLFEFLKAKDPVGDRP